MVDNVDVRSWLCVAAAAVRLSVRISGCGRRRLRARVLGWAGRTRGLGHEWFNKVLVSAHVGYVCAPSLRSALAPLEPVLIRDVGCLVDRIRARVAPDFGVSIADKEACDGETNDCTEHKTANARSNSHADGDAGSPGRKIRYSIDRDWTADRLPRAGRKTRIRYPCSAVDGSVRPRSTVGISENEEEGGRPSEGDGPVYGTHVI